MNGRTYLDGACFVLSFLVLLDYEKEVMPRKVRQLIKDLLKSGFTLKSIRGSHRKYENNGVIAVLSGAEGDDARNYQEKLVRTAIARIKEIEQK